MNLAENERAFEGYEFLHYSCTDCTYETVVSISNLLPCTGFTSVMLILAQTI